MSIIGDITRIATYIMYGVIIMAVIVGAVVFYFIKFKRAKREEENESTYAGFSRRDSKKYLPINTITDDMIFTDNNTRFISSVNCIGYDFFQANASEQIATQEAFVNFTNTIDSQMMLWVCSKAVDLEAPIKRHKEILGEIEKKLELLYSEYVSYSDAGRKAGSEYQEQYAKAILNIEKKIEGLEWEREHVLHLIFYQEEISGDQVRPVQENRYMFDWTFRAQDFPPDITEDEIKRRASEELNNRANQIISVLSSCGVKGRKDDTQSLIGMVRRHMHPYGANIFKMSDVENSSMDTLVVTTKNYEEAKAAYKMHLKNSAGIYKQRYVKPVAADCQGEAI